MIESTNQFSVDAAVTRMIDILLRLSTPTNWSYVVVTDLEHDSILHTRRSISASICYFEVERKSASQRRQSQDETNHSDFGMLK